MVALNESVDCKRAEQPDLQNANFFACLVSNSHCFLNGAYTGAHHDNYAFGIWRTFVFEELIRSACECCELIHFRLHDVGHRIIKRVTGLASLKEHVRDFGQNRGGPVDLDQSCSSGGLR